MLMYDETLWKKNSIANNLRPYQQCSLSVMDTISDPYIQFDEEGICNYFEEYKKAEELHVPEASVAKIILEKLIDKIKNSGKGKKYDCITGISGGVDSTYLAYQAKLHGLRPLIVHFDNGWNSELAVKNIESIITKLGFDLFTLVVDWNEFKNLQLAYLKASVVDIEAVTDHAIIATLYKLAVKYDIKYILSGTNVVTEATLPANWIFNKMDHTNIQSINKAFGKVDLKSYPLFDTRLKKKAQLKGIETLALLNYMPYDKKKVKDIISKELNWRDYGGKHHESVFTRFYQGYILPLKFGIDKRKAHLSNLIFSGQISKEVAIDELKNEIYPIELLKSDYEFVLKKLGLSKEEFSDIMLLKRREHTEFETERSFYDRYLLTKPFKKIGRFINSILVEKK